MKTREWVDIIKTEITTNGLFKGGVENILEINCAYVTKQGQNWIEYHAYECENWTFRVAGWSVKCRSQMWENREKNNSVLLTFGFVASKSNWCRLMAANRYIRFFKMRSLHCRELEIKCPPLCRLLCMQGTCSCRDARK